jgi:hypothetical protein
MGGKCLVLLFGNNKDKTAVQMRIWSEITSCIAALGFFIAFVMLIFSFNSYADKATKAKQQPSTLD